MKLNIGQVENILKLLVEMRYRPGMVAADIGIKDNIPYSRTTYNSILNALQGVRYTFDALGIEYPLELERKISEERGHERRNGSPVYAMLDDDKPEAEIIKEMLTISILAFQRRYGISDERVAAMETALKARE